MSLDRDALQWLIEERIGLASERQAIVALQERFKEISELIACGRASGTGRRETLRTSSRRSGPKSWLSISRITAIAAWPVRRNGR